MTRVGRCVDAGARTAIGAEGNFGEAARAIGTPTEVACGTPVDAEA